MLCGYKKYDPFKKAQSKLQFRQKEVKGRILVTYISSEK